MTSEISRPASLPRESYVVYGLGATGKVIVDFLVQQGARVEYVIDKKKAGTEYGSLPVISLEEAKARQGLQEIQCVLGLHNHYVDLKELNAELEICGFKTILTLIQLAQRFPEFKMKAYWLDTSFKPNEHLEKLTRFTNLLADEKSKIIVSEIWNYRASGKLSDCPQASLADEYTPIDLPRFISPLRLIDCGAYRGVAIHKFLTADYKIDAVAAFEPDLVNFERLCESNTTIQPAIYFPLGVWSSNIQLKFSTDGSMGSAIQEGGNTVIQCIKVDSALKAFKPNLIKYDVEGAEIEALLGSQETIKKHRPNLCVSIYHTQEHLYEIACLIESWNLGYQFHVRVHEHNTFGIVLYCYNKELTLQS